MTVFYQDSGTTNRDKWVKDKSFQPNSTHEKALARTHGVDLTRYKLFSKYEEHYGFLARIARIALGVILSPTGLFSNSCADYVNELLFQSIKATHISYSPKLVNVEASLTGNPTHIGHMQMIALGINRLIDEGYEINTVNIALADEQYLSQKVHWCNVSIQKNDDRELLKISLPTDKRIEFLRAAIEQAKTDQLFRQELQIDYFAGSLEHKNPSSAKTFLVCGADFASELQGTRHAVIVTRNGERPKGVSESHEEHLSRLIVDNTNLSSDYSSSAIQNGKYEQLPSNVREEFRKLHRATQISLEPFNPAQDALTAYRLALWRENRRAIRINAVIGGFVLKHGQEMWNGSRLFDFFSIPDVSTLNSASETQESAEKLVGVVNMDTFAAAQVLVERYKKVLALNLASTQEPGGGFDEGVGSQEEELCWRSDLGGMMDHLKHTLQLENPEVWNLNVQTLYTPGVTVFRSSPNYALMQKPFQVSVLSSAAVPYPKLAESKYANPEDENAMRKRIYNQLYIAEQEGHDALVLGAFGCGAFGNPATVVAKIYQETIDAFFKDKFEKIVFAVLDRSENPEGNFRVFQKQFS